jgi:hypothetical protein
MGDKIELEITQGPVAAFNVDRIELGVGAGTGLPGTDGEDPTATNIGAVIAGADAKATLIDADSIGVSDSAAAGILKKWTYANIKTQLLAWIKTAYKTILGQYDTRTDLTATNASTMTCNYSLGNAFKIDASAMGAGESFTITMSNLPASAVYSAWSILIVTGANLPTVSYTNLDADVATPVIIASKDNEIIGRTWDNGTKIVYTVGESF